MIRRSRNTSQRSFGALFTLLVVVVVTLATTGLSAAGLQIGAGTLPVAAFGQGQTAPKLRVVSEDGNPLAHIVISPRGFSSALLMESLRLKVGEREQSASQRRAVSSNLQTTDSASVAELRTA
ncbi:MAG TPA: hypothetical protein VEW46_21205 [Pyrinomonadaceae bacterium]|nr:hypothetical protein [Pyrinomonadaceae bacterium]